MKLSIIVPIYNRAYLIKECLESLRRQAERHIEIILVDDGSTDDSARLCNKFVKEDGRFIYFYKKNEGAASARNYGIRRARGDYISFVDSDDVLHEDFSSIFMRCASKAPEADIISGNRIASIEIPEFENISDVFENISALELIRKGTTSCTRAFKRDLFFQSSDMFPEKTWAEDNAYIPVLATRARLILHTRSVVYWQRAAKDPEQNTSLSMKCLEDIPKAMLYLDAQCDSKDMVCNVVTRCVIATYFRLREIGYPIEQFNRDHDMDEVFLALDNVSKPNSIRLFRGLGQKAYFLGLILYSKGFKFPLKCLFYYSDMKNRR